MFFKKKRSKEIDLDALNAEVMFRLRGLFLDSQLEEAFALSVIAGTTMVSDEVAAHEQEQSDKRVARILHLLPLIHTHAYSIAKATVTLYRTKVDNGDELPEEVWEMMFQINEQIAIAAVMGSLSQIVDLDLLTVGPRRPRK